jgi:transcriptional antiterminator RfaH
VQPGKERVAEGILRLLDYDCYCPRLRIPRISTARKKYEIFPPLFSSYIFILIVDGQFYRARWAPYVSRIIYSGQVPAVVPVELINEIRSRETNGAIDVHKPSDPFRPGAKVKILSGPFKNNFAIYANTKPKRRVEILLSLLGAVHKVTLAREAIEAVEPQAG